MWCLRSPADSSWMAHSEHVLREYIAGLGLINAFHATIRPGPGGRVDGWATTFPQSYDWLNSEVRVATRVGRPLRPSELFPSGRDPYGGLPIAPQQDFLPGFRVSLSWAVLACVPTDDTILVCRSPICALPHLNPVAATCIKTSD